MKTALFLTFGLYLFMLVLIGGPLSFALTILAAYCCGGLVLALLSIIK